MGNKGKTRVLWLGGLLLLQVVMTLVAMVWEGARLAAGPLFALLILQVITTVVLIGLSKRAEKQPDLEGDFPELLSPKWMQSMLAHECKRAVREFVPLTMMGVIPAGKIDRKQQEVLGEVIRGQLLRSGDMICAEPSGDLTILLPATNEAVKGLAQRCLEEIEACSRIGSDVRIVVCTFQPSSDLDVNKVSAAMNRLREQVNKQAAGSLICEVEQFEEELPGPTYLM